MIRLPPVLKIWLTAGRMHKVIGSNVDPICFPSKQRWISFAIRIFRSVPATNKINLLLPRNWKGIFWSIKLHVAPFLQKQGILACGQGWGANHRGHRNSTWSPVWFENCSKHSHARWLLELSRFSHYLTPKIMISWCDPDEWLMIGDICENDF